MKFIHFFALLILFSFNVYAEEKSSPSKLSAQEYLAKSPDEIFPILSKMNKTEAVELISQIRKEARAEYKGIDKFYLLISHLENIKAIEEEQARLKSLNVVYGLGIFGLIFFMGYILFSQRRAIQEINRILNDK